MVGLLYIQRELSLNYFAILRGRRNGLSKEVSWMLLVLITTMSITNAILLLVGVGALLHVPAIGFLLAGIPVIKLVAALLVVRSLRKQLRIYRSKQRLS